MINILFSLDLPSTGLEKYIKPHHRVTILQFSINTKRPNAQEQYESVDMSPEGEGYKFNTGIFKPFGIDKSQITLVDYYNDSFETMKNKIEESDILFLPGGYPTLAMARIEEKNLVDVIRSYDKTIIGMSAGAQIQLGKCFDPTDEDYREAVFYDGLNLMEPNIYIQVHYNKDSEAEVKLLQKIVKDTKMPIYAIDNTSCVIYDDNEFIFVGDVEIFK